MEPPLHDDKKLKEWLQNLDRERIEEMLVDTLRENRQLKALKASMKSSYSITTPDINVSPNKRSGVEPMVFENTRFDARRETSTQSMLQNYLALERGHGAYAAPSVPDHLRLFSSNVKAFVEFDRDSPHSRMAMNRVEMAVEGLREHMNKLVDRCRNFCQKGIRNVDHGRALFRLLKELKETKWSDGIGPVAPLIANVGETLDELESYREGVLSAMESSFSAPLEDTMNQEIQKLNGLKKAHADAKKEFNTYLDNYLAIKPITDADEVQSLLSALGRSRTSYELSRFDLIGELNSQATKKRFQLCDRVCSAVYGFLGYHHTCHSLLAVLETGISQLSESATKARKLFAKEELLRAGKRNQLERDLVRSGGRINGSSGDGSNSSPTARHDREKLNSFDSNTDDESMTAMGAEGGRVLTATANSSCNQRKRASSRSYAYRRQSLSIDLLSGSLESLARSDSGASQSSQSTDAIEEVPLGLIKAGYLYKQSTGRQWQRRWFYIRDGKLYYTREPATKKMQCWEDEDESSIFPREGTEVLVCDLMFTSIKPQPTNEAIRRNTFLIVSPNTRRYILQAESDSDAADWIETVQREIERCLTSGMPSSSDMSTSERDRDRERMVYKTSDDKNSKESDHNAQHQTELAPLSPRDLRELQKMNPSCADCGTNAPTWASINIGVLLCIDCSGVHRSMGSHVSKVRSLNLDLWSPSLLKFLFGIGNDTANAIFLAKNIPRPKPNLSSPEKRIAFIQSKYIDKIFVDSFASVDEANKALSNAACKGDVRSVLAAIAQGADVNSSVRGQKGKTALHLAVIATNDVSVELLCQMNAHVDVKCYDGMTALDYATKLLTESKVLSDDSESSAAMKATHVNASVNVEALETIIDILVVKLQKDILHD